MEKVLAIIVPLIGLQWAALATTEVDLLNPDCEVRGILQSLESSEPVKSDFLELRSNPFHRLPRRFKGTIYWHPDYGLSLDYNSPVSTRINVDREQVTILKPGDPPRQLTVSDENPALGMFLKLFDWDTRWIAGNFTTGITHEDAEVVLRLEPKDDEIAKRLNGIILKLKNKILDSIELDLSGQREIQIRLSSQVIPWEADTEMLSRQFSSTYEGD